MKKFVSLILISTFLCASLFGSSAFSALFGDVNSDNDVNNKDVMTLFRYLSGADVVVDEESADINNDGKINNKDVTCLFRGVSSGEFPKNEEKYRILSPFSRRVPTRVPTRILIMSSHEMRILHPQTT